MPDPDALNGHGLRIGFESDRIHPAGLIVQSYSHRYSHWEAAMSLSQWLKREGIPAIHGIDTRMLAKKIRSHGPGSLTVSIHFDGQALLQKNHGHLVDKVSTKTVRVFGHGNPIKVLAVDCGIKASIIRHLVDRGAEVKLVPWTHGIYSELQNIDGIVISNGPGDPADCAVTINQLKKVMAAADELVKPVFGICLGHQLLALAAGAEVVKMPFCHRGHNQPVINSLTGECHITAQNHGYAVNVETLPTDWKPLFINANDDSNEGIVHKSKPFFAVQFHPEANGGPTDTAFLFDVFVASMRNKSQPLEFPARLSITDVPKFKKVLVLGSGGLSIGQGGEFDYSGSQAIKALKEEGIWVVLVNPNIASVQTNAGEQGADVVHFLPITAEYVEQVIQTERPDGILISMGGQTALNCGLELARRGILAKYDVKLMGTPLSAVIATEDRALFNAKMQAIGEKVAVSATAHTIEGAVATARQVGYPVMIRAGYALGGLGSSICADECSLIEKATLAFAVSPHILVEQSLMGWKELEYEVLRDVADNCIVVCNMENMDPVGVHTGDSIVVAPSQTLSNREFHMLREAAIKIVRALGIIGECNVQFALHPRSLEYRVIEVNARLSRSSALASKATCYPLAFIAAKLALGVTLPELSNKMTGTTSACFEPSLDYVVTKVPKWDLNKFRGADKHIGTAMKSVGEVMAFGRTWEESIQKAMRMLTSSGNGLFQHCPVLSKVEIIVELQNPTVNRIFAIVQALEARVLTAAEISQHSSIGLWFIAKLQLIVDFKKSIQGRPLSFMSGSAMREVKQLGFSDLQLSSMLTAGIDDSVTEDQVRAHRLSLNVKPFVKQVDTLAGEYPSRSNCFYMTYHATEDDVKSSKPSLAILGSGPYGIGSSVEFDWCSVSALRTLRKLGKRTVMINCNPSTVSTDCDECDRLYIEELSKERALDILEHEQCNKVMVSVGGQTPNNLAVPLHKAGVHIVGTSPEMIDSAEDRNKFSKLIDKLGLKQPKWAEVHDITSATNFAANVGYPVLLRPSYALSGAAMRVAYSDSSLEAYLQEVTLVSADQPMVITKFIVDSREVEVDGVAKDGEVFGCAVHEHVENAGVHSGDATLLHPCQAIPAPMLADIDQAVRRIVKALQVIGPFNMQFIVKGDDVLVIECNLRASRSFPFTSKALKVDFIDAAVRLILNEPVDQLILPIDRAAVKVPVFSFARIAGADPVSGVEMASTGEVACFGLTVHDAFLKAMCCAGYDITPKSVFLDIPQHLATTEVCKAIDQLKQIKCLLHTSTSITGPASIDGVLIVQESNLGALFASKAVDLVFSLRSPTDAGSSPIRRMAADFAIPLLTNAQLFAKFVEALVEVASKRSN